MNNTLKFMPQTGNVVLSGEVFEWARESVLQDVQLQQAGNAMLSDTSVDVQADDHDVHLQLLHLVRHLNRCHGNAFLDVERMLSDICLQSRGYARINEKNKNDRTLNTNQMMNIDDIFSSTTRTVVINLTGVNNLGCLQQNCIFQHMMRAEEQTSDAARNKADAPRCDVDMPSGREDIVDELTAIFNGNRNDAAEFVRAVDGARPTAITRKVNQLQREGKILRSMSKRPLWAVLHRYGIYKPSESNWNSQVN